MSDDALVVDEVDVTRAPGFESGGFTVDTLSPGITVVHGPNASGKTTLARSIQWLLWPGEATDRASVAGHLSLDGETWRVDLDPGGVRYQRDGQETNGPNLPPADQRDRYRLPLHDLLQQDTRNRTFARTIKRESAGGYDIAAAHDALDFADSPSDRRLSVVGDAEQAIADLREAQEGVRELRREQNRLSSLRRDLEDATAARERVALLDQAIEYAEAERELERARERVAEFPGVLADLTGDEADRVDDLAERIADWRDNKADAEAAIAEAEADLAEAGLPEEGVPAETIDRLRERRDEYESLRNEKGRLESDLADAESQRANARSDIPLGIEADDLGDLDPGVWEEVSAFAREAESVRAEREVQQQVQRWLADDDRPDTDEATVKRASNALEQWLASGTGDDGGEATGRIAGASAVLLAVAGGMLGVLVHPALFAFALAGVGVGWYGYRARTGSSDARATHRETVADLGIAGPSSWTESAVRDRLHDLYDELAAHHVADQRAQLRETLSTEVDDLAAAEADLADRRERLRDTLGVAPDTTDIEMVGVVKGILRWQEHQDRVEGCRAERERVEERIEEVRDTIADELAAYGYQDVTDVSEVTAHIRDLERRKQTHDAARDAIDRAQQTIDEAEEHIAELEAERAEVFETAGLSPGDDDRLRELCERVPDYEAAVQERATAAELLDKAEEELAAYPDADSSLRERSVPDLEQEKRDREATAERYDEISREITEIETKIDEAKRSNDVEEALAEKERALNAVADQLTTDYDSMVGHVLTEHVREATQTSSRPAVFRRAGELLARITKGRYRLDLDESADEFRAYDTVTERGCALDELSSATWVQVLLAVRVAFVEQQEQGVKLPLVLDETLANTDDAKAAVIIESIVELAREGRQVFYFTAQGDEVARWLAALADRDDLDHAVVDLAEVRDTDGHVDVPALDALADHQASPPAPDGHDHESYGEALDVPAVDPRRGAGNVHLWYVVDDVDILARLLDLGIERWGQLETLLERTSGTVLTDDPETLARIERTGAAVRAFVDAWQTGRGDRVDRQTLREADAVSENFIDEVTALADQYDGDAGQIIDGLRSGEVDRFRESKKDELERYFEENGYVEPVDPLDPEEIRARVVQAFLSDGVSREQAAERAEALVSRLAQAPA